MISHKGRRFYEKIQGGGSAHDLLAQGLFAKTKSQAHYKNRKSQSILVQFCPLIPKSFATYFHF